mmetsp:Transcript_19418/g.46923  ORF Transcript_19418/g.46923 Transcript_19418/m.46923 type:complete len:582 (+) Transcript_19418:691-2436(+)
MDYDDSDGDDDVDTDTAMDIDVDSQHDNVDIDADVGDHQMDAIVAEENIISTSDCSEHTSHSSTESKAEQVFHLLFGGDWISRDLTVILQDKGSQLSDDEFDELLSLVRRRRQEFVATGQVVLSWKRLIIHLPIHPGVHIMNKAWLEGDDGDKDQVGNKCGNTETPRRQEVSLNLTSQQSMRFINMVGNQQVRVKELYIAGNNRVDNLIVPLLLGRMENSTLLKLKWSFSYGRQWPMEQVEKFASVLKQQDRLQHLELTNLDFLLLPDQQDITMEDGRERQPQPPPLDIIFRSLERSSNLRTFIVQMKHGSNLRHLIRQPSWDNNRSSPDEPFHTAEVLGRFIFHHLHLEHFELLNWDISDLDCQMMAEAFRYHQQETNPSTTSSSSIPISRSIVHLKTMILSHYHQSSSCTDDGTTTDGLRNLLSVCLDPTTTRVEQFSIIPSLPWTRTRSNSNQMSTINGSRQLEALILGLLRENCYIQRLCVAVPGVVFSQATLCQIELYEKFNQAGRRYLLQTDNDDTTYRTTWLKQISRMASGIGPDGQEYSSLSAQRYSNDMVFLTLKETAGILTARKEQQLQHE